MHGENNIKLIGICTYFHQHLYQNLFSILKMSAGENPQIQNTKFPVSFYSDIRNSHVAFHNTEPDSSHLNDISELPALSPILGAGNC
jgi:hypothetical protein